MLNEQPMAAWSDCYARQAGLIEIEKDNDVESS